MSSTFYRNTSFYSQTIGDLIFSGQTGWVHNRMTSMTRNHTSYDVILSWLFDAAVCWKFGGRGVYSSKPWEAAVSLTKHLS